MAVESSLSKDMMSRNRDSSEPKKKLKKTRSIKLSRVASLKPSSRRSKSRLSWVSIDFSNDPSSTLALDFPDSTPNYMKATNSSDSKKDFSQGGSEIDDTTSIGSSSYESLVNGLSPLKKATKIQKTPKTYGSSRSFRKRVKSRIVHQPSIDPNPSSPNGSPRYFKLAGSSGSKKVNSDQASPRNSESSLDKTDEISSLKSLVRTPSVRVIMNKTSFKPKKSSLKRGQVIEELNVDRATCSSTLKGKRFTDQKETDKVCPYNHCSLHGHRHGHETPPPPPLKRSLNKKGRSVKSQKSESKVSRKVESSSVSSEVFAPLKDGKDVSFSIEIYAKLSAHVSPGASVEVPLGESSYHGESLNQMMSLIKTISDLKENSSGCSCKTKVDISSSVSTDVDFEVHDDQESSIDDEDQESTINDEKEHNGEAQEGEESTVGCDESVEEDKSVINVLDEIKSSPEKEVSNSIPAEVSVVGPTQGEDIESGARAEVNKNKSMSMWHMIHRHMASTLASSGDKKINDINPVSETTQKLSDFNIANENRETINQDLEQRKVFAIKIVREAIEKILLPEIPDQSSDDLSVTSDAVSEQDLSEKNLESSEGSERVDPEEASEEKEKRETRVGKESDKKAPKHWSNLKKWIILQRFVKALEKVKKFNPSKPHLLPLEVDPEAEKVTLRPQTVDEKKNSEEWMLDYALRQAVDQLAPTQKKKVALLVKAFETVVPPQEESSGFRFSFSKLKVTSDESPHSTKSVDDDESITKNNKFEFLRGRFGTPIRSSSAVDDELKVSSEIQETVEETMVERVISETEEDKTSTVSVLESKSDVKNIEEDKKNKMKMWHMVYQHVVSSIAEKVGSELLEGTDDEAEDIGSGFSRSEADRLVQEAVDEILLPEIKQSEEEEKTLKSKNWSKLKKHMLMRRSINALQKGKSKNVPSMDNPEAEKFELRNQMMDERTKAEQWMLDYAVQNIVHTLTPARKRRVAMLVEAFEAVVPFPEI